MSENLSQMDQSGNRRHHHRPSDPLLSSQLSQSSSVTNNDDLNHIINLMESRSEENSRNPNADTAPQTADIDRSSGVNLRNVMTILKGSPAFIAIALAKNLYEHRLGIITFLGLYGTFYQCNSSLIRQITIRKSQSYCRSALSLLFICAFLIFNTMALYYVFQEEHLYKNLYFMPTTIDNMSLWNLFWVVGLTDFVIKFFAIFIKSVITLLPNAIIHFKKRGNYYMVVEYLTQFYRKSLPIAPWLVYLLDNSHSGMWFSILLVIIYVLFKARNMWICLKETVQAIRRFKSNVRFGEIAKESEMVAVDPHCPICQDYYAEPIILTCKHIFCEDCVALWFDREPTCPMCRANIADNPIWRDGSTSSYLQLY